MKVTCLWLSLSVALLSCGGGDAAGGKEDLSDLQSDLSSADLRAADVLDAAERPDSVELTDATVAHGPAEGKTPFPWSAESSDEACDDGLDNDSNGYIDCKDFACSRNLAVFVCGSESMLENSPEACSDGVDNDGDSLSDCWDPDCQKNPFHGVCTKPLSETQCAVGKDGDGDGFSGCDDLDCVATNSACGLEGRVRVLFDQTLDETAASGPNSDWVVDSWGRLPAPSNPRAPEEWSGALSAMGFELVQSGAFVLESLVAWDGRLSFGDDTNPQDLSHYGVLVLFEPSRRMEEFEKEAILRFVLEGGGGLIMVANHTGADRDGNGWSAPMVYNDMLTQNTVQQDPFGVVFDEVDAEAQAPLTRLGDPTHPLLAGPFGTVTQIGFYQGCTAHLSGSNANVWPLVLLDGAADDEHGIVALALEAGAGRVVVITDSAIGGDGTDSHGNLNPSHDSWSSTVENNRELFLNAFHWVGRVQAM